MNKPEILAPCGTWQALEAAIKGGADAVYLGGTLFSARAFAGNFDTEELLRAIDYCHFYDAKIYMALNTLLKDDELGRVVDYMEPYYRAGLDAVIVQDFGVARILRDNFPLLQLHASTQMSVSSSMGAAFLKNAGFTRVVPAREVSLEETRKIKETVDIEVESFVHGAMCYAYSGKCLLSSFIGGRSGNRGRCAQPCRQCYKLTEQGGKTLANEYVMSLKDMCTLYQLPELIDCGIDSFKIEGRMKKPEYVAQVARAYKEARDMYLEGSWNERNIQKLINNLADIYNRGGFHSGYYYDQNGKEMLASKRPNHTGLKVGEVVKVAPPEVHVQLNEFVNAQDVLEIRADVVNAAASINGKFGKEGANAANGRFSKDSARGSFERSQDTEKRESGVELTSPESCQKGSVLKLKGKEFSKIRKGMNVYRIRNNKLIGEIKKDILDSERQIEAQAFVEARIGSPLAITIWSGECCASVTGGQVSKAENRPSSPESIIEKMQKTGGTGMKLDVSCGLDENAFVQMSELNALRRQAMEEFKVKKIESYRR